MTHLQRSNNNAMPGSLATSGKSTCSSWACLLLLLLISCASATHHSFRVKHDPRSPIGPVGIPFGFLKGGYYDLEVFDFDIGVDKRHYRPKPGQEGVHVDVILDGIEAGFYLQRFENEASFTQYYDELRSNSSMCAFEYFLDNDDAEVSLLKTLGNDDTINDTGTMTAENGLYLSMNGWRTQPKKAETAMRSIRYTFAEESEEGLYFLIYQICPTKKSGDKTIPSGLVSTFELNFHFLNFDRWGNQSYLTAGEMHLPLIFFYFTVSYAFCCFWWVNNIRKIQEQNRAMATAGSGGPRPVIYAIHHLMSALLVVKTITILLKSIRYHYIRVSGHAELWSFVYYVFAFLKGTFLFIVILLIGSGWSMVKPFLNGSEKKIILAVLILQVINNIALVVLARETEGESSFDGWTAILHLVDIICCCAVLIPIVWQVNQLEKSVTVEDPDHPDYNQGENSESHHSDSEYESDADEGIVDVGEKGRILSKLKLFRSFYLLVVAYVYSTRILVYLFATLLNYKHLWIRYFIVELITLVFYVVTGIQFRPMVENLYQGVKKGEDDDDDMINERELEMSNM